MMFKSIRSRLALSFAGIALVAALALGVVLLTILRDYYSNQESKYLRGNAESVSTVVAAMMSAHASHDEVQSQVDSLAFLTLTRIRVYDLAGQLIYDSGSPQKLKVNLGVVKQTFIQNSNTLPKDKIIISVGGSSSNESALPVPDTVGSSPGNESAFPVPDTVTKPVPNELASQNVFVYHSAQGGNVAYGFALRLPGDASPDGPRSNQKISAMILNPKTNEKLGSVQLSEGPAYGSAILESVARGWVFSSAIAVLLAALIGWYISRRISAPVLALTDATGRMTQGDLSSRADVTSRDEFGQLARSFNEMAAQVEQTVSTLRAFVADAAHELHTPLAALQTNLELARDENNASERTRYLTRAQEQGQRLEALVKSLLDLSRIEAREAKSNFAPVNILQLVREVGEQFASRAEQTERIFTMQLPDEPARVRGNETQLRRVVVNLLENAIKFTPANGTISLTLDRSADEIHLTVSDSGIGIPPEDLSHLFERFHRGRNASEYPGSGLGLAIVKAIVGLHQGTITAQSEEKQGATFTLSLPIESTN
jgi:signal transduction histidine kinase